MSDTSTTSSPLAALTPGTWTVDASHSTVSFVARHLMVSKVRGNFTSFAGTLTIAEDRLQSSVEATVDVTSVNTGDAGRDGHLTSGDFFEAETYPTWKLASTSIRSKGSAYVLVADLTIKSVTKSVEFSLEFDGVATDPWGNTKAGFEAELEISREEFGLVWNVSLETGGVLISDKIKLVLDVQALKA